jgi:PhzF family phenazine biosynthesis protein
MQVDAFTRSPCAGNPAAVCLIDFSLSGTLPDATLQAIAAENNLSETAFVTPLLPGGSFRDASEFALRWFTPTVEVALCGHATMAAAAALLFGTLPILCAVKCEVR